MVFKAFLKSYPFLIKYEAFFTMALAVLKVVYIISLRKEATSIAALAGY